jgi:hypothetical protein
VAQRESLENASNPGALQWQRPQVKAQSAAPTARSLRWSDPVNATSPLSPSAKPPAKPPAETPADTPAPIRPPSVRLRLVEFTTGAGKAAEVAVQPQPRP